MEPIAHDRKRKRDDEHEQEPDVKKRAVVKPRLVVFFSASVKKETCKQYVAGLPVSRLIARSSRLTEPDVPSLLAGASSSVRPTWSYV